MKKILLLFFTVALYGDIAYLVKANYQRHESGLTNTGAKSTLQTIIDALKKLIGVKVDREAVLEAKLKKLGFEETNAKLIKLFEDTLNVKLNPTVRSKLEEDFNYAREFKLNQSKEKVSELQEKVGNAENLVEVHQDQMNYLQRQGATESQAERDAQARLLENAEKDLAKKQAELKRESERVSSLQLADNNPLEIR